MPRIDVSETIKMINFPDTIWEWLDLLGDVLSVTQAEADYQDQNFIANTPFKKILLCTINKDLSNIKCNIFSSSL